MPTKVDGTEANFLLHRQTWREGITKAVDYARKKGRLIVFSAGNNGEGEDCNHHPEGNNDCDGKPAPATKLPNGTLTQQSMLILG